MQDQKTVEKPRKSVENPADENPADDTHKKKRLESPLEGQDQGGPKGPDPTRYGDWEKNGRCIDF